jgi:hypothetical protein
MTSTCRIDGASVSFFFFSGAERNIRRNIRKNKDGSSSHNMVFANGCLTCKRPIDPCDDVGDSKALFGVDCSEYCNVCQIWIRILSSMRYQNSSTDKKKIIKCASHIHKERKKS